MQHKLNLLCVLNTICFASVKLKRIDQFFRRARRYGYAIKEYDMSSLIEDKDRALFRKKNKHTEHVLYELLPEMKHDRCLFHNFYIRIFILFYSFLTLATILNF